MLTLCRSLDLRGERRGVSLSVPRHPMDVMGQLMSIPDKVHAAVLALYREVDAAVAAAGPVCVASGRCCRFKEYGHVLFLSNLEAAILLESAPAYERPARPTAVRSRKKTSVPPASPGPLAAAFTTAILRIRRRAIASRKPTSRRLKEFAEQNGLTWEYRPLHYFLNQPEVATARCAGTWSCRAIASQ